ncbi:MAG: tRNA (cytidine(34)-2'-O)-methyltransferase [Magnetococcales bacterium]|nr:tRNA (cytidine(34)-2'-O)-methyltransferase [Magnetococcales bacterium]
MTKESPANPPTTGVTKKNPEKFQVILYQPEIPPNTGNILRLTAATGSSLHLVGPLGFRLDAAGVRRAGMDYRALAEVTRHADWPAYLSHESHHPGGSLYGVSTHGERLFTDCDFQPGDRFLFGSEGAGLPEALRETCQKENRLIRLPMLPGTRSLNIANSVAVILYEALRQNGFPSLQ